MKLVEYDFQALRVSIKDKVVLSRQTEDAKEAQLALREKLKPVFKSR